MQSQAIWSRHRKIVFKGKERVLVALQALLQKARVAASMSKGASLNQPGHNLQQDALKFPAFSE